MINNQCEIEDLAKIWNTPEKLKKHLAMRGVEQEKRTAIINKVFKVLDPAQGSV